MVDGRGASPETMRPLTSVATSGYSTIANSDPSVLVARLGDAGTTNQILVLVLVLVPRFNQRTKTNSLLS